MLDFIRAEGGVVFIIAAHITFVRYAGADHSGVNIGLSCGTTIKVRGELDEVVKTIRDVVAPPRLQANLV